MLLFYTHNLEKSSLLGDYSHSFNNFIDCRWHSGAKLDEFCDGIEKSAPSYNQTGAVTGGNPFCPRRGERKMEMLAWLLTGERSRGCC